ncbi:MAG: tetratricopeptide repeat protein [Planctomycetes bacterium]|nr:tetratricopeptide repeat protein [Planctomycetota bacterium]
MGNDRHLEEARKRGRALVQQGLITTDQLGMCLKLMEKSPPGGPRIEDLLVQLGYLSKEERERVRSDREAEESPAREGSGASERPSARGRTPRAGKPSGGSPPASDRKGASSRRAAPRAEEKRESRAEERRESRAEERRESRSGARGQPSRGKKKVKLSRRSRVIQFAIFFSPVVVLAGVIVWRFSRSDEPAHAGNAPSPAREALADATGDSSPAHDPGGVPDAPGPDDPGPGPEEPAPLGEAEALFERALADLANPQLGAAEALASMRRVTDLVDRELEIHPSSFEARLLAGRARSLLGDVPDALVEFDFAVEARPRDAPARMARAAERFRMHWREMARLGVWWEDPVCWPHRKHLDGVIEDCREVVASGDKELARRALPYLAFAQQNPAGSLGYLKEIPELDADLYLFGGIVLHWSAWAVPTRVGPEFGGLLNGAVESYRESLKRRPHALEAWIQYSVCLADLGQTRDAAGNLEELTTLLPDDPWLQYALGRVYTLAAVIAIKGGDLEKARSLYTSSKSRLERALALNPEFTDARALRANILRRHGDTSQARRELEIVLKANDRHILALFSFASLLEKEGHPREAAETAGRALELRPTLWDLYFVQITSHLALGEIDQAQKVFEALLARSPPPDVRAKAEELLRR